MTILQACIQVKVDKRFKEIEELSKFDVQQLYGINDIIKYI